MYGGVIFDILIKMPEVINKVRLASCKYMKHRGHQRKATIGFKIKFWARPEGKGCIVIRRRPITQPKIFISKPIYN